MPGWKRFTGFFLLGMAILFLDFLSKGYVYHVLSYGLPFKNHGFGLPWPIFTDFFGIDFSIDLAMNRGMALGLMANLHPYLFVLRIIIVVGLLIYLLFFNKDKAAEFPLVLIAAGAIGNIIDFFLYGSVVDFLHFKFWNYHFFIFNFADVCITVGVVLLIALSIFRKKKPVVIPND